MVTSPNLVAKTQNTKLNLTDIDLPKVSVVIPVHNNVDRLPITLETLQKQTYPQELLEIIVVDNNSSDGSDSIASQFANINLIYQKDIQNAAATRNAGIIAATGEIIAFIDADCVPALDWIERAIINIYQCNCDRIGGRVIVQPLSPNSPTPALLDALYSFNQELLVKNYQAAMTGNFIAKKEVFQEIGHFNSDFFELEDIDLGVRATTAGFSITYADDCIVYHEPRNTIFQMWKKGKRNGRGMFSICENNLQWKGRFGWKHLPRTIKTLITPRQLHWNTLPFSKKEIKWNKKIAIYFELILTTNIAETLGYFQYFLDRIKSDYFF
jgi:glycosyltransferase involved in cell wall biosynthesis